MLYFPAMGRCLRLRSVTPCIVAGVALASAAIAPAARGTATGTLKLKMQVPITYLLGACPAGVPAGVRCADRTGAVLVPGLGRVEQSYAYRLDEAPAGCPPDISVRGLPSTALLTVPGKGAIEVQVGGTDCEERIPPAPVIGTETFTVTGGSGKFAGASGGGTIDHISNGPPGWNGQDTWSGTLTAPGLEFDLTPPTISGAADRTVQVPRYRVVRISKKTTKRVPVTSVRVKFQVTAEDDVDGRVPAACQPKSGAKFKVGRTRVSCSSTDTSANAATAQFTVTVKRK